MKHWILLLLVVSPSLGATAQTAASFFPTQSGYEWHYTIATLDTLQTIIPNSERTQTDSLLGEALYRGKLAKIIRSIGSGFGDSSFVSFEGSTAFQYIGAEVPFGMLPPALADSLQSLTGWYSTFRFGQAVNQTYTLLTRSLTVPVDSNTTLPVVITITGRRLSDQTVSVPFGTFTNAKRFLITTSVGTQVLPPPFPPLPLFSIPDTTWIAPNTWIVKRVRPTVTVNLSSFGVPAFSLPGELTVLSTPLLSASPRTPVAFELSQNYPNPFNPTTTFTYRLLAASDVRLEVFDVLGRKVATLVQARQSAGAYRLNFNAAQFNLASGLYFYRLTAGTRSETRKMILTK